MIPHHGLGANMRRKGPLAIINFLGNIFFKSINHQNPKESHGATDEISFLKKKKERKEGSKQAEIKTELLSKATFYPSGFGPLVHSKSLGRVG